MQFTNWADTDRYLSQTNFDYCNVIFENMILLGIQNYYRNNVSEACRFNSKVDLLDWDERSRLKKHLEKCKTSVRYRERFGIIGQYEIIDEEFSPGIGNSFDSHFKINTAERIGHYAFSNLLRRIFFSREHRKEGIESGEKPSRHSSYMFQILEKRDPTHANTFFTFGFWGILKAFHSDLDITFLEIIGLTALFMIVFDLIKDLVHMVVNKNRAIRIARILERVFYHDEGYEQDLNLDMYY